MTFDATSLEDTAAFAERVAAELRAGDVVALGGDLGAGKTTFVRALVAALGGDARTVSSPTFVLLNIYETPRLTVYHLDAYRVHGADELDAIGFGELIDDPDGLTLIEWPSRVAESLPGSRVELTIQTLGPTARRFTMTRRAESAPRN